MSQCSKCRFEFCDSVIHACFGLARRSLGVGDKYLLLAAQGLAEEKLMVKPLSLRNIFVDNK